MSGNIVATIVTINLDQDEDACYDIALRIWEGSEDYQSHPRLPGDKIIGHFLTFSPNHAFVCVNNSGEIIGRAI